MKVIALDIETANLDMHEEGLSFSNPRGWKTSCICIYDACKKKGYYYVRNPVKIKQKYEGIMDDHPVKKQIFESLYNYEMLKVHLKKWLEEEYTLITHNGNSFDLPIISKSIEMGGADVKHELKLLKQIDTCDFLLQKTGYRFNLQNLIKGLLGEEESKLMKAAFAPREWAVENYLSVLGYCMGDSIYTWEVYKAVKDNEGCFTANVKHNRKEFLYNAEGINW